MASDSAVRFDAATAVLRGQVRPAAAGDAWAALVLCHGHHEDMDAALLTALAGRASEEGLWTLRFNFAFRDAGTEPSGGHADEISDLREATWGLVQASLSRLHRPEHFLDYGKRHLDRFLAGAAQAGLIS